MKTALGGMSLASLGLCFMAPFLYFWGSVDIDGYKNFLLAASLCYFVFATAWITRRGDRP